MTPTAGWWRCTLLALAMVLAGCSSPATTAHEDRPADEEEAGLRPGQRVHSWVYQLQGYRHGRLAALAKSRHDLAVIDLARDAHTSWFSRGEVRSLQGSGKKVLAYFEVGSIENFRPEYRRLRNQAPDLVLNRWDEWPEEFFVRYWTDRWWRLVVRPRVDRALDAGYDGVYLDTLLAYESIPLGLAGGRSRHQLGQEMVDLVVRLSRYAKARRPGFWVVPQNSPELRRHTGYLRAIDGIAMEELFFRATDRPCSEGWCGENLRHARRIRAAGKFVLAVDYAHRPRNVSRACAHYTREGFIGYVTDVTLDRINPPCTLERQ